MREGRRKEIKRFMANPKDQRRLLLAWPRLSRLLRLFLGCKRIFAIGAVFLVVTNVLALQIPSLLGDAIEHLRVTKGGGVDGDFIAHSVLMIVLLALGSAAARIMSRIFIFNGGRQVEYQLRNQVFTHLTGLARDYFERVSTGDLVSRTINDVNYVRVLFGVGTLHIVNTSVAYVIILSMMASVDSTLTWWALAPYPLFLLVMRLFTSAIYKRTQQTQAQLGEISAQAQENLSGMAVVKAFAIEAEASTRFKAVSDLYLEKNMSLAKVRGAMNPYVASIGGIGTLIVLGFGGSSVIEGTITLGQFVEFSAYIVRLAWPTMAMGWVISLWQRGMAGFDRLCDILEVAPEIVNPAAGDAQTLAPRDLNEARGELVFEDVSLVYDDGTTALRDLNLTIKAGTTVAIVGRTGAGKSSLVELIPRLRDPVSGTIRLDGVPLNALSLRELRGHIGFVPQSPFLFSTTIDENIRFGLLAREALVSDGRVPAQESTLTRDDAIRVAALKDEIPVLIDGLETIVGERGVTLSGGQKQRVTIARAVLLDPTVLILDDSLASVDTQTERRILEELSVIMRGRTSILVTHRFNALEVVDEVIVLDEGRLVERGKHRELIAAGGYYAAMVERQRLEEVLSQS